MAEAPDWRAAAGNKSSGAGVPDWRAASGGNAGKPRTQSQGSGAGVIKPEARYEQIKVLADGTELIRMPNGKLGVLNQEQGFSSTNPEDIAAAQNDISPLQTSKRRGQEQLVQQAPMTARLQQAIEGVPFIGSWFDEVASAVSPELGQKARAVSEAKRAVDPIESTALQFGGGLAATAATLPLAAGSGVASRLAQMPFMQRYLTAGAIGGVGGAAEGAIYGAGQGQDASSRIQQSGRQALVGGLFGTGTAMGLPVIADIAGAGWANMRNALNRSDLNQIQQTFNISRDAAKVIKDVAESTGMDLADALGAIQRGGNSGMIADADNAFAVVLDAAMAASPAASSMGRSAVEGRASQTSSRLSGVMDDTMVPLPSTSSGMTADAYDIASAQRARTAPERNAMYNLALNQPVNYSDPLGRDIEGFLQSRVDPSIMQRAINEANAEMREFGVGTKQIMAKVMPDGTVSFEEMPNMVQLHEIKKAIGEIGYGAGAKDVQGKLTPAARRARNQYRDLNSMMSEANPIYRRASQLGGDSIIEGEALDLGVASVQSKMTANDLAREIKDIPAEQRQFVKMGLRAGIEDILNRTKATIASPEVDVNQARKIISELSSASARNKMSIIMGPTASKDLFRELDKIQSALELRAATARGSQTAQRTAYRETVEEVTQPGAVGQLAQGSVPKAVSSVARTVTGATPEATGRRAQSVHEQVVRAMTTARGEEAQNQLKELYAAVRDGRAKQADFDRVSGAIMQDVSIPLGVFGLSAPLARDREE